MSDVIYSEKLGLNFKNKQDPDGNRVIVFEDGVNYRNHEIKKQNKVKNSEILKKIHDIKKIFNGTVVLWVEI